MGDPNWNFTTAVAPVIAPAGPGAFSLYSMTGGGETVTTDEFVHTFDTPERLSASHVQAASGFELEAGHHLVIYNSRFDSSSGGNRSELQSNLNLAGTDLAAGWSQGYIRRTGDADECITAGGAIIDVTTAGDLLQLQSFRTDDNGSAGVIREPGATGIQLLKLDDTWDYLSLAGHDGSGTDQEIGSDTSVWTPVIYNQEIEKDTGNFTFTPGTSGITLGAAGHYMVFANTYATGPNNRRAVIQRLALDGTEVPGSRTMVYLRNDNSCQEGAASLGMIIETAAANQILTVDSKLYSSQTGMTIVGPRSGVTVVKLPDSADYVSLENSVAQSSNPGTAEPLGYDTQLELDSAFSHDAVTDNGRVTVNSAGDFLFLANQYDFDNSVQRVVSNQGWQINGAGGLSAVGQTASYGRADGGTADVSGNWSGFITGLGAADYVETLVVQLGTGGGDTVNTSVLQGVSVASLFSGTPPGGNDFTDWIAGFPGVGASTGFDDDADGDGNLNGVENYLGTDPSSFTGGPVAASFDEGAGTFTFSHPLNASPADDITASYQWSTGLSGFVADGAVSGGTTVTFSQGAPVDGVVTVTATITGTPVSKLFVQILVEQTP